MVYHNSSSGHVACHRAVFTNSARNSRPRGRTNLCRQCSSDKEAWNAVSQWVVGRREFTPVKMIRFSPGVCLSKCWNSALDVASSEQILIANNDIIFHKPGWLEKFDEVLSDPTVGVTGIVGMSWNNIPFIQGSLFAVLRGVYDLVGPFDERFEFTCEDIDYSK